MFWSFVFYGRDWLLNIVLIIKMNEINGFCSSLPRINSFDPDFFCDQIMFWSFVFCGRDWLLLSILTKTIDFIDLHINILTVTSYRQKFSKLQNIIWSQKKIWIKTIDSRQRTTKTIDFVDLRINILTVTSYRPKNSKLQNIIWSEKNLDQTIEYYKNHWFHRLKD